MVMLADAAVPEAKFESSGRYPCHPGTRLDISQEIQSWMHDPSRTAPVLWLKGPAGVGKSAIIRTVSELESKTPILGATFFFSKLCHPCLTTRR
jgi:hypothetical protein